MSAALFDSVLDNLSLAPGEYRLIATTRQTLGNNQFRPASTQTEQQTLVVVHLKRPGLLMAQRDQNLKTDFTEGRSDQDWEEEIRELERMSEAEDDQPTGKSDGGQSP